MEAVQVKTRALWLPKAGHGAAEYEDAFALPARARPPLRAAVADGATESAFARGWAEQLVRHFVAEGPVAPGALEDRLQAWQTAWERGVAARVRHLPWYAAAKAEEGAYAAFLGFSLKPDRTWQAVAVGDCCLFHLRGDRLVACWPVTAPEAFHNRPPLLASRPGRPVPEVQAQAGTWQPGDAFLLATDAFSAWLMRTEDFSVQASTSEAFGQLVGMARAEGSMRNDDVTLVMLQLEAGRARAGPA